MNALFVANKPAGISSNHFLSRLKRKYGVKKAGFSGTLDPFASGCLIVALGNHTRLFNYVDKTPKIYEVTMWLGATSASLDNENIEEITRCPPLNLADVEAALSQLKGEIAYVPPKFSAKHVDGKRAYELARAGEEFELKSQTMSVFDVNLAAYMHPFLSFCISVSEGSYVRSYAQILAKKLGVKATLSALKRVSEGKFIYENERFLNPLDYISLPQNEYLGDPADVMLGKKLSVEKLKFGAEGLYLINFDEFFSIIEIKDETVTYKLNKVEKC